MDFGINLPTKGYMALNKETKLNPNARYKSPPLQTDYTIIFVGFNKPEWESICRF